VREVAGWDFGKAREVARWPLREVLLAFLERMKDRALEGYRHECLMWGVLEPHRAKEHKQKPPAVPDILKIG